MMTRMIELEIKGELLIKHRKLFLKDNKENPKRLYKKLENLCSQERSEKRRNVYRFILHNIEEIITGDIFKLWEYVKRYNDCERRMSDNDRLVVKRELQNIFVAEYEYFTNVTKNRWNAYQFTEELQVSVCPYCGTQFIFTYSDDTSGKTRPTLDHFFDKSKHPYLAVSLYNLVPCCKVCNSDMKGQRAMNLEDYYSPYEKNIVECLKVKVDVINTRSNNEVVDYYDAFIGGNNNFDIKFTATSNDEMIMKKISGNVEMFKLEEIYNEFHKPYVRSIMKKAHIYNQAYLNYLRDSYGLIFSSEEDLRESAYPKVEEDPFSILGKMTRDIIQEQFENKIFE